MYCCAVFHLLRSELSFGHPLRLVFLKVMSGKASHLNTSRFKFCCFKYLIIFFLPEKDVIKCSFVKLTYCTLCAAVLRLKFNDNHKPSNPTL